MQFNKNRRHLLRTAGAVGMAGMLSPFHAALAEDYPSGPVRLVNPFAPGGTADMISRLFSTKLSQLTKANIVVVNLGGAGGTIGSDHVAKSPPDGYALLLSNVASQAIASSLYPNLPYDPVKGFEHIAMISSLPNVLVVGPAVKANNYKDFIAEAKAHPGQMTFGSAGNGSSPHLSGELLNLRTGIKARHVPYKGAGPALMAVIGGELSFQFENCSTAIPQVKAGKLRALGVTSAKRIAALPDVPTMGELGVPDFVVGSWYGLSAPPKTPKKIVDYWAKAVATVLQDPDLLKQLTLMGAEPPAIAPSGYTAFIDSEMKRWSNLIKSSGAKVD